MDREISIVDFNQDVPKTDFEGHSEMYREISSQNGPATAGPFCSSISIICVGNYFNYLCNISSNK